MVRKAKAKLMYHLSEIQSDSQLNSLVHSNHINTNIYLEVSAQNKKIIFDEPNSETGNVKKKAKLFDDDAEDDNDFDYAKSFEIKKQYEGEKGARLQKLQSRFQNDQRFNMDEKFLDDDVAENKVEGFDDNAESKSDERQWQYDMLESVMGKKLQPEPKKK